VVETDIKYSAGMLNNLGKISNATVNFWINYIRMNFFFKIVYKKKKTFGLDKLLRRK